MLEVHWRKTCAAHIKLIASCKKASITVCEWCVLAHSEVDTCRASPVPPQVSLLNAACFRKTHVHALRKAAMHKVWGQEP